METGTSQQRALSPCRGLNKPQFYFTAGSRALDVCRQNRALLQKWVKHGPSLKGLFCQRKKHWLFLVIPRRMRSGSRGTFKQRTSGEYGEEKLISSLPFSGLIVVNRANQIQVGLYGSLVALMSQAFLAEKKATENYCQEMQGSEKDRKTAHEELKQCPLFRKITATLRVRYWVIFSQKGSLPRSLPSACASTIPSASGSFSQNLVFNRALDR